jgi:hypothetical protein
MKNRVRSGVLPHSGQLNNYELAAVVRLLLLHGQHLPWHHLAK